MSALADDSTDQPQPEALYYGSAVSASGTPVVFVEVDSSDGAFNCTGVVIKNDTILTAAHCLDHAEVYSILVVASDNFVAFGTHYGINKAYIPLGIFQSFYDLGYVKLNRKLPKSAKVAKITSTAPTYGEPLYVFGYGYDEYGNLGFLRAGIMQSTGSNGTIIGAVRPLGGSSVCAGDSGGPAFVLKKNKLSLVGITSFGSSDCEFDGGFTALQSKNAKAFIKFAKKKVKKKK